MKERQNAGIFNTAGERIVCPKIVPEPAPPEGAKRRRGRPKRDHADRRTFICVVSRPLYERMQEVARAEGLSVSAWARKCWSDVLHVHDDVEHWTPGSPGNRRP